MEKNLKFHLVFWPAVFFLFFFWIGQIPLVSSDEGRFGEIAREMWVSKDFIVPHFDYIPHIEKPIFAFWLAALNTGIFGVGSFSARLPSVISAILGILLTHFFTRRWFNRKTADFAAVILTTSVGYVLVGRFAIIDMLMTLLMSGALFCLASAAIERKPRLYFLAYVFMGLSLITKGLIGVVLPSLIFFVFLLWIKNLGEIKKMHLGWGVLIIALIFFPWAIAISNREPGFFYRFIIEQHFHRYSSAVFGRKRPFWFFAPLLVLLAFPWSFFLPAAIFQKNQEMDVTKKKFLKFLICWLAVIFVFFSIPKSKLPYYILPLCVPLAILVAAWIEKAPEKIFLRTLQAAGVVSLVVLIMANLYLFLWVKDDRVMALRGLFVAASLGVGFGVVLTAIFLRRKEYEKSLFSVAVTLYILLIFIIIGMKSLTSYLSTYEEAVQLKALIKEGDEVAVFASPDRFSDLSYHLEKRILVVGSDRGTLGEELKEAKYTEDAQKWFPSTDEFLRLFNTRSGRIYCLMEEKNLPELQHLGLSSYKIIRQGGGKLLISNEI